jgi:hypothetical protein
MPAFQLPLFPPRQMSTQGFACMRSILEQVVQIAISVLRSYDEMRWLVPVSRFCAKLRDCFQVVRGKVLEVVAAHRPMDVEWGALFRAVVSGNGYSVPDILAPKRTQAVFRYFVSVHQYRTL